MTKNKKKSGNKERNSNTKQNPRSHDSCVAPGKGMQSVQQLASYRLHQLATLSERYIGMRYRRKFGLRMMEVGILMLVGGSGPLSFKTTYTKANLEKSNASRLATQLLEKGLLEKREDQSDQRSFYLALTPAGENLYQKLRREAFARNERWMAALPKEKRAVFLSCLEMLTQRTQILLQEETDASGLPGTFEDRAQNVGDSDLPQRILLDAAAASQLYALLGAALGKNQVRTPGDSGS